jgi:hypothetical protein
MMLRAFFDESGTDPVTDPALVMGGFLGSVEECERATESWDEILAQPPKIEYFKRVEYINGSGQFKGIREDVAELKVNRLAATIPRFDLQGFCVTVSHDYFTNRKPEISKGMMGSRIYDWAFIHAVMGALRYLDTHIPADEKVDFIFDERSELKQCIPFFYEWKRSKEMPVHSRAGTCGPGSDQALAPLQMADLLAGECLSLLRTDCAGQLIVGATGPRGFIHLPVEVPEVVVDSLRMQAIGKKIFDRVKAINRRYHKDKERSPELSAEMSILQFHVELYLAQMHAMTSKAGMKELWDQFEENTRHSPKGKDS